MIIYPSPFPTALPTTTTTTTTKQVICEGNKGSQFRYQEGSDQWNHAGAKTEQPGACS